MKIKMASRSTAAICLSCIFFGALALPSYGKAEDQSQVTEIVRQEVKAAVQYASNQSTKFLDSMGELEATKKSALRPVMLQFFIQRRLYSNGMKRLRKMDRSIMAVRSTRLKIRLEEAYRQLRQEARDILDKGEYKQFREVLDEMAPMPRWGIQPR